MALKQTQLPLIHKATVMHSRKVGRANSFVYKILFLQLPLGLVDQKRRSFLLGINKFSLLSFFRKDHGERSNVSPKPWLQQVLEKASFKHTISSVQLLTLPRVFGYAFKPVSFWFCLNQEGKPIAVVAEVNNTFGETHTYVCGHEDGRAIADGEVLTADKVFHVSPFIQRDGYYAFKFSYKAGFVHVGINHFDEAGELRLSTSLACREVTDGSNSISTFFLGLGSLSVFPLILWQALKIWLKGIAYVSKPKQQVARVTKSRS